MPKFFIAVIIGIVAFSATYLILTQKISFQETADITKIFANNFNQALQNTQQNQKQQTQQQNQQTLTQTAASQTQSAIIMTATTSPTSTTTSASTSSTPSTSSTSSTTTFSETISTTSTTTSINNLCKGRALCANDTVTNVVDGDTIDTQHYGRIRLSLVNSPEKNKEGYQEAKDFTTESCLDKNVLIDQDDGQPLDEFGRKVAVVYCDYDNGDVGYSINAELFYGGFAEVEKQFCSQSEFATEQWAIDGGCTE